MNKSSDVRRRRRARELAVQMLYSLDTRPDQDLEECLGLFMSESENGPFPESGAADTEYMLLLVRGVWKRRLEIDDMMRRIVTGWRPERMVAVDRSVLRLSIFEGFLEEKVPHAVAISEAVELARAFGTEDSGRFVNGVLAKVLKHVTGEKNAAASAEISTER